MIVRVVASHRIVPQTVVNYRPLVVGEVGASLMSVAGLDLMFMDWATLEEGVAALLRREANRARFVLLGEKVAWDVLGTASWEPHLEWMEAVPLAARFLKIYAAIVPQKNGSPETQRRADEFWRALLEETR